MICEICGDIGIKTKKQHGIKVCEQCNKMMIDESEKMATQWVKKARGV